MAGYKVMQRCREELPRNAFVVRRLCSITEATLPIGSLQETGSVSGGIAMYIGGGALVIILLIILILMLA